MFVGLVDCGFYHVLNTTSLLFAGMSLVDFHDWLVARGNPGGVARVAPLG
jgi:hypothetical protein